MDNNRNAKPTHIVLWGGWYGSHNIGDQLLLLTITALIQSEFENVTFTILTDSPNAHSKLHAGRIELYI